MIVAWMRSNRGLAVSALAHAIVLAWGLISFAVRPLEATPAESLPVDIISDSEFSQITAGQRNAKQAPKPKPLVEKVAEAKPVEEQAAKVTEKKEIPVASPTETPPTPEPPKPVEKKQPQPKEQAKAEPKPAEKEKSEPKPDPIAEALKKEEAKKPPKKPVEEQEEAKKPPKKPVQEQPKFDPKRVAALLDKRAPERHAAAGDVLNSTPTMGLSNARAATLSQNELDALRAQIQACWNPPAGVADARDLIVRVRIALKIDGSLAVEPTVTNRVSHPVFNIAAESALRAVRRCQPFRLPAAKYEAWKDVEVTFDPRDLFRG